MEEKGKILVAVSGGVDSTAAALMLKREGYAVEGAVMLLTEDETARFAAEKACEWLEIPLQIFDFRKEFRENVTDYFVNSYILGTTPNPCVVCNRTIKFGAFLQKAREKGFEKIATGHYASNGYDEKTGRYFIKKAASAKKDQSYFLHGLSQDQISSVIFPLGNFEKEDVRQMLEAEGFENARKSDSQDICFVSGGKYADYITGYTGKAQKSGYFKDIDGNILGKHEGIINYTIGQRKGVKTAFGKPLYVKSKDAQTASVIMAENEDLFSTELLASDCNMVKYEKIDAPLKLTVKTRSVQKDVPCTVIPTESENGGISVKIVFDEPQRAVTPGQFAVFYEGDTVVGGGTIIY